MYCLLQKSQTGRLSRRLLKMFNIQQVRATVPQAPWGASTSRISSAGQRTRYTTVLGRHSEASFPQARTGESSGNTRTERDQKIKNRPSYLLHPIKHAQSGNPICVLATFGKWQDCAKRTARRLTTKPGHRPSVRPQADEASFQEDGAQGRKRRQRITRSSFREP